jgi:hypothetical protein
MTGVPIITPLKVNPAAPVTASARSIGRSRCKGRRSRSRPQTVASVGEDRKPLIFKLDEINEMTRGKGVILQRFADGKLADVRVFRKADGLTWLDSAGRRFTLSWAELRDCSGRRFRLLLTFS